MTIHQTIKSQIKEALRAKDTIRLDTLRGLNALAQNELFTNAVKDKSSDEYITDERMLALVKRSVKQRKDSIEQFTKGGRNDLVSKERAELSILESFMPSMMTKEQIKLIVHQRIDALRSEGNYDPKANGRVTGMIMKELAGKADGNDVKAVVDELMAL